MDHIKVLKRAWHMVWNYRALWVFGIILALVTSSGGGNGGSSGSSGGNGDFPQFDDFAPPEFSPQTVTTMIAIGIGVLCVIVLMIVIGTIARYVAETALIRMVAHYEETNEKLGVRQGFRLGWSRTAFRIFLIDLLASLPVLLLFILMFLLPFVPLLPLLLGLIESTPLIVISAVVAGGLFFLMLFLLIVVGAAITLLKQFFWRACALDGLGVIESIREGFGAVRRHLKDVVIMWLIMIGIRIGWAIAVIASLIVLFPVLLLLIVVGALLGGIPAFLVWGLTTLLFGEPWSYILAGVIGLPIFILVMAAPWVFLGGLMEVFKSSTWTLTYRELRALESLEIEPEELPAPDEPDSE